LSANQAPDQEAEEKRAKDMNPKGFWECPFTVQGVRFRPEIEEQLKAILSESEEETFCKIVSQGVAASDPRYITKLVVMVRDPRSVAKSQERLTREFRYRRPGQPERNLYDGMEIHSPKMFIDVTLMLSAWIKRHPDIPVHYVEYDNLVAEPEVAIKGVLEFLGEKGAAKKAKTAASEIDPKLKRSYPEPKPSLLWDDAERVHDLLKSGDHDGLERFAHDKSRPSFREDLSWVCVRVGSRMVEAHCSRCIKDPKFAASVRAAAERSGIQWRLRPCAYETAYREDGVSLKTIDQSILDNHWITQKDRRHEGFEAARLNQIEAGKRKK
jgi:hypothetical protein